MGSSSPDTQTVTQTTEIDPFTQKWREALFSDAQDLYRQGPNQAYTGATVAPLNSNHNRGIEYTHDAADDITRLSGRANSAVSNMMTARPVDGGSLTDSYGSLMRNTSAGRTTMGVDTLQAMGQVNNPYLDGLYQQGKEQITEDLNARFAGAGRSGPNAAYGEAYGESLGDLYTNIYAPAFENQQNRAMQAASTLAGIDQTDRAVSMQGLEAVAGMREADRGFDLAARDQADTTRNRALALSPSIAQLNTLPGSLYMNVGDTFRGITQADMDRRERDHYYNQQAPWDALGNYASVINGLPDFSSTSQTSTGPGRNQAMGALGGAAAGAGIASALGATGPWGWGAAGLGAALGLF